MFPKNIFGEIKHLESILESEFKILQCDDDILKWASFPYLFGSTSGPHGGIGGRAMAEFQIYIFQNRQSGKIIKYCDGTWKESTSFTYDWE